MSVINNVLKGLENRESHFTPIEIPAVERAQARGNPSRRILYSALLLLLLAAAGGIYQYHRATAVSRPDPVASDNSAALAQPPAPVVASVAKPEPVVPVEADAAPASRPAVVADLSGNQIIGLQVRESETEMQLEFALRERAVAYLKERGENRFVYHLRATESQIAAPLMRDNRWIRKLAIQSFESGVDIDFVTAPDILVETRQLQIEGEQVWAINLRQARPAAVMARPEPVAAAPAVAAPAALPAASQGGEQAAAPVAEIKLDIKSTNPVSTMASQLEYAVELMNSGRPADAEKLLLDMLGGASDYRAREHLMALYIRQGRPARLRSLLLTSLAEYPRDPLFRTEYARSLFQAGAYRDVIALLAQDASIDVVQRALLAASYQRLDLHAEAIANYRLALQQDAGNARNWVGLGISQEQTAAFVDALASYQRAARLGGLNARLQAFVDRRSDKLREVLN